MGRLDDYLKRSVAERPSHVAIEDPERDTWISYQDLARLSDRLSNILKESGLQVGDRVGIYAPKSIGSVAAIFGILKAGAAYVPVDPLAPPARNAFIFGDCDVRAIVVERALVDGLRAAYHTPLLEAEVLFRDEPSAGVDLVLLTPEATQADQPTLEGLAYILYTSGSTGKPKGVIHTHASAASFVDWCSEILEPVAGDRFSSHAPFHFDLSILDLYVPIKHGATIVLIGEELGKTPLRLAEVISERRISMWYSTPSILRLLVEYGRLSERDYSSLRVVNFAGEVFPVKHLAALKKEWPHPVYFNLYGPTETNVCTFARIPDTIPQDRTEPYPIGKTCSNDETMVADEFDRPVPDGEEGELYVTGGSVMQGYWNLPERTERVFHTDDNGTRWYRTGDIVRKDEHGDYIFIGRRDRMVKRRGYRVELGEIEVALYRHPSVNEAGVIAIPDEEQGVLIKAFLSWADGERGSQIKMKQFAAANLPLYMIPDRFSFLTSLPKTSTDKIDYQRLKDLD